jgi:transposase-like protein
MHLLQFDRCHQAAGPHRPGLSQVRCRDCGKQFDERSGGVLNHARCSSDVIALVVLWRLRYRLTLRDLSEMFP